MYGVFRRTGLNALSIYLERWRGLQLVHPCMNGSTLKSLLLRSHGRSCKLLRKEFGYSLIGQPRPVTEKKNVGQEC